MVDTTNGQLYAPVYSANKLVGISTALGSYVLIDAHPQEFYDTVDCDSCNGQPALGMYRVGNCSTDACVTYLNSGHTGAIHIQGLPAYHNADYVGNNPINVIYDTSIGSGQIGTHVTVEKSGAGSGNLLWRMTHFPI